MRALFILIVLIASITSTVVLGQKSYESVLHDIQIDSASIRKYKIRSLIVYKDYNEDGVDQSLHSITLKKKMVDFDTKGNRIWVSRIDDEGTGYMSLANNKLFVEKITRDSLARFIEFHWENSIRKSKVRNEFDEQGRLIRTKTYNDGRLIVDETFEWKKGKMVKATTVFADELNKGAEKSYDEMGRLLKYMNASKTYRTEFRYTVAGNELRTVKRSYRGDTLYMTEEYAVLEPYKFMCKYVRRDHNNTVKVEMKTKWDEKGNLTYYFLKDLTRKYHGNRTYLPLSFNITNTYDSRGLLVKRYFYYSREDVGKNILTNVERYFYDKAPLDMQKIFDSDRRGPGNSDLQEEVEEIEEERD